MQNRKPHSAAKPRIAQFEVTFWQRIAERRNKMGPITSEKP